MSTPIILAAQHFDAPLVNPAPSGLFAATTWPTDGADGPNRLLGEGMRIRTHNYGGEAAFGVWTADWCVAPDDLASGDIKDGVRPSDLDPFAAHVAWAYDSCDMTVESREEVRTRVQQILRLQEQTAIEAEFAARALADAPTPTTPANIVAAVGAIEAAFAKTNTVGLIHASAALAAVAANAMLITRSGAGALSPMGHRWVFGGGYVDRLGNTLVGTSPTFGWRDTVSVRESYDQQSNTFVAVAERAIVVGYERAVAAATITTP